jgi:hypothetical protein
MPVVYLSVCKLLHFILYLQNHWANFNQTRHKSSLGKGDSRLFMKENTLLQGEIIARLKKYTEIFKKSSPKPDSQFQTNLVLTILE